MARRSAFTLVELLIVIGILATLLAILLPTFRGVRDRATTVDCASRLRELYLAQTQHAMENRGKFAGISNTFDDRWERKLSRYLTRSQGDPAAASSRLLHCPAFDSADKPANVSSYGLNSFVMKENWRMRRDAKYASSNIILFADKSLQNDDFVTTDDGWFLVMPGENGLLYRSTGHTAHSGYRHGKSLKNNVVMADGHVQSFRLNELSRDSGHWYWGDTAGLRLREVSQGTCCP
jgi:prepilin-type N-terminal cleavage/methylation domain-containing protein/prepilin-type processing-associated H-X9-DG protein